ncbi:MAG: M2 family metallopeptidase [Bradymonadia bacterium]
MRIASPRCLSWASLLTVTLTGALIGCGGSTGAPKAEKITPKSAKAFAERVHADLKQLWADAARAEWVAETYITDDTGQLAAAAHEKVLAYNTKAIQEAARYNGLKLDQFTARTLYLLKISSAAPAPSDPEQRGALAQTLSQMGATYGKGKWCPEGKTDEGCLDLGQLSKTMARSRDYDEQLQAWLRWRTVSPAIKPLYEQFVRLANAGAKEIGFTDLGDLWRSGYDMPAPQFEAEAERLWQQVRPLYESLHCHVRAKLAEQYPDKVKADGTLPAHLMGNMWAQEWSNLYASMEPFPGKVSLDVTGALESQKWGAKKMVKVGEDFFTGLGMKDLPESFYQRSMLTQPRDRDVVCHASAWDVTYDNDVRIKMCIKPTEEDLITIHHELGHIYYYQYYHQLPVLFQNGAHDGFHEAIGDALALSVTPSYLKDLGLLTEVPSDEEGLLNVQFKTALDKIAFLPFGRMIDQWRWDVFSGKVKPGDWNAHWWTLRAKYQGLHAPVERPADAFDPGAKYHIPANTPYVRYFLSFIIQFQFYKALCEASGHTGPLHTCNFAGSKAAGDKLSAMLKMGASKPWPEAMKALTGQEKMSAEALLEYFQPLKGWLDEQNKGRTCGW